MCVHAVNSQHAEPHHLLVKRLQDDRDGKGIAQEQRCILACCVMAASQQAQPCSNQIPWDWGRQGGRLLEGAGQGYQAKQCQGQAKVGVHIPVQQHSRCADN